MLVSSKMRSTSQGLAWYCQACDDVHPLPSSWTFDGNYERPTFSPSFKHTGKKTIQVNGRWAGDWVRDENGRALDHVCHYIITAGVVNYCGDCSHSMAGMSVPMPDVPVHLQADEDIA